MFFGNEELGMRNLRGWEVKGGDMAARMVMAAPGGQNIKFIRRGGIYCARRRVSEANRRAAAALRPEIPPVDVCGAAGCGGMRASRPTADRMVTAVPVWRGISEGL